MTTIVDAAPAAEETYATEALQESSAAEREARVDAVARPLIEQLGRLIEEAQQTTKKLTTREARLTPQEITERKGVAITYYADHADQLSGRLTQEQCIFLLRIASDNRNFLALERLLSTHHAVLSDPQILKFSKLLSRDQIQAFLNSLDIPKFISLYHSLARELPDASKDLLLTKASDIPEAAYSQEVYSTSFSLAMALEDLDFASDLILNKSETSPNLSEDISVLATRLRNRRQFDKANSFLTRLPVPLFDLEFSNLFRIFSETLQVKQVLYSRALDSSQDLFNGASYRNALQFFLTNNLDLAKRLILENSPLSSSLGRDTLEFIKSQKASDLEEACHFVQNELPDANFALCWNELLQEFWETPATFNFLVSRALQRGLLTDASFTEDLKYRFETLFGTWMTPAHRPEAINLFRLLQTSLNFYNRLNNGNLRLTTPHTTIYDDRGTQTTASQLLSVDCHGFSRYTATIQIEFALNGHPVGTRALWVHGAGTHSAGGVPVLKNAVPGLWANIQIIGSQIMGRTMNLGATVVERT